MTLDAPSMLDAALAHARRGWPVLPLYEPVWADPDGPVACACGTAECSNIGKHPRIGGGFKNATTDEAQIRDWWAKWPEANIGVPTGTVSGLVVLDIDPRHGGDDSLDELEARHGKLPHTVEQLTGGGGRHLCFAHPGGTIKNRVGVRPGIDIRGDGGYIVVEPSLHASGRRYAFELSSLPGEVELAEMSGWLLDLLAESGSGAQGGAEQAPSQPAGEGIAAGQRNATLASLAGTMRRRGMSEEAIAAALLAENRARCRPPLPDTEVARIAKSVAGYAPEIEAIAKAVPWASVSSGGALPGSHAESWPDPEPLPDELPPVERFDPRLLPESLRAWAVDIAERTQCPIDYVAVGLMVGMSSVVGRTVGIRPKRFDDWTVVPNLWGGVVGRPGVMKSPALQEALKPLRRLDLEAKHEHEHLAKEIVAKQEIAEARKRVQKEKIKKAVKAGEDPLRLAMESIEDDGEEEPTRKRYIVNDTTVEKLGEILNENPRGVLVFRDELVGLLKSLDKEGQEGARGFYLQAWNGDGSYIYDRIGRGTIDIEAAIVSVLGGIQPGPLSCYLRAAAKGGADDDGLMQRFQLLVWPDVSKAWINVDRFPDSEARRRVFEVFAGLDALEPDLVGADNDPMEPDGIPFLRFEEAAQAVFDEWREHWERRLRSDELPPIMEAHLSKYRSLVPSMALLSHLADGGRGAVGLAHLLKALEWADYLESHAKRIYSQAINPDLVAARSLAKHILGGDVKDGFALREVYRKGWSGLSSAEDAKDGAAYLTDLGWLREVRVQTEGRTGTVYLVNPMVSDLKTPDGPGQGTDRTDRSAPDTPSVSSVSTDQGASCENEGGDEETGP